MSRFFKSLAVIASVWLIMFVLQEGIGWLPSFGIGNVSFGSSRADRQETLTKSALDLTSIRVETYNGGVTLHGRAGDEIEIQVRYQSRDSSKLGAERLVESFQTDLTVTAGELLIKAKFAGPNYNNQSASYEVYLPPHLLVSVQTSNGPIVLDNLAGEATLQTSNGPVSVTSNSDMGKLDIHSSNAKISVAVPTGLSELTAISSNGRIEVLGNPATGGRWQLRTSNGGIQVALPQSLGVKLDASTSNSTITVGDGPWSVNGGKLSSKQVNATRGDGMLELLAHTSNGPIQIVDR